jgi:hypothetical protein
MAVRPFAFAASLLPAACLAGWTRTPYTMDSDSSSSGWRVEALDGQRPAPRVGRKASSCDRSCSSASRFARVVLVHFAKQPRPKMSVTLGLAEFVGEFFFVTSNVLCYPANGLD